MSLKEKIEAVYNRNGEFDDIFLYSVSSTMIYCKPSCPSKKPREENIAFFDSSAEAEESGYRACKRCEPGKSEHSLKEDFMESVTDFIDNNLDDRLTLKELST